MKQSVKAELTKGGRDGLGDDEKTDTDTIMVSVTREGDKEKEVIIDGDSLKGFPLINHTKSVLLLRNVCKGGGLQDRHIK